MIESKDEQFVLQPLGLIEIGLHEGDIMQRKYAGVGSRQTPVSILQLMEATAKAASSKDWFCCTGGAKGADQAFMRGAEPDKLIVYPPWKTYEEAERPQGCHVVLNGFDTVRARELVLELHPNPSALTRGPMAMHMRNVHIVLGSRLDRPVEFVLCWTPGGKVQGGTGMAIRTADLFSIPVINMATEGWQGKVGAIISQPTVQLKLL